jgi:hypothetical protein
MKDLYDLWGSMRHTVRGCKVPHVPTRILLFLFCLEFSSYRLISPVVPWFCSIMKVLHMFPGKSRNRIMNFNSRKHGIDFCSIKIGSIYTTSCLSCPYICWFSCSSCSYITSCSTSSTSTSSTWWYWWLFNRIINF